MNKSPLQAARHEYEPKLPPILKSDIREIGISFGEPTESVDNQTELKQIFERTYGKPIATLTKGSNPDIGKAINVGVILSGGQAPGGHNVICGLFDGLKKANSESKLFGFLGGPSGLLEDRAIEITPSFADEYRNTGGFDMIGSGRTKIEADDQFEKVLAVCEKRELTAVVVIGGDDSNTNAALMAEFFAKRGSAVRVIGVPKTIDGDLKNTYIEASFGFDTATKTYSELIGNIERDANSAKKYWHFIKLMGRSASHIALECALQTHPNICIISEEVEEQQQTLDIIVKQIADVVTRRADNGENFGVVLIPEGLIEFIPEMKRLIAELNDLLAQNAAHFETFRSFEAQCEWINKKLGKDTSYVFSRLPNEIQRQLLMDRDPHGNVQVSRIETEKLLIEMVQEELSERKSSGHFKGKFASFSHFFGYEGRCAFPSNFDADYCYSLGYTTFMLIASGLTGYLASVRNLSRPAKEWEAGGVPLTMMMNLEQRHGQMKPVIKKALVELEGAAFRAYGRSRDTWALKTSYFYPGAIQYYGPDEVCNRPTLTLAHEHEQ